MSNRIIIMIDENLDKKLRMLQSKRITKENRSVSFSEVINQVAKNGLDS